ncbi:MAG: RNA polymerase III subunit C82 [Pleopsidium flavum]|nr:MAG: RNA polymerase III subunit C82 [Pleopsidium flavum]
MSQRVFTILLRHGRLHLSLLIHHTGLSSRQLKHALAVLIQQHLVYHHKPPEGDTTYYEADWKSAYALVRPGKIIKLVEERFGNIAGGVVSNLLLLGHARVDDLATVYKLHAGRGNNAVGDDTRYVNGEGLPNGVGKVKMNGKARASGITLGELHATIHNLLHAGFLMQVQVAHFRSVADNRNEAERTVQRQSEFSGTLRGTKQKVAFENAVQKQLQEWQKGDRAGMEAIDGVSSSKKRTMGFFTPSSSEKRARLDNGFARSQHGYTGDDNIMLDDNLVLRINHEKITVAFRSQRLIELAERCIGKTTSQVYAEVLRRLERNIQQCHAQPNVFLDAEDETECPPTVTTTELSSLLRQDVDFMNSIGKADVTRLDSEHLKNLRKRKKSRLDKGEATVIGHASPDENEDENTDDDDVHGNESEVVEDSDVQDADANINAWEPNGDDYGRLSMDHRCRMLNLKQHLHLLAEDPYGFIQVVDKYDGSKEWTVDFGTLAEQLRQLELENTVTARFGAAATRLIRIFLDKGKLDEKQITNLGLIHQKQMRAVLTVMHEAGHLELQEVPRDNNRQPSRTMYLWYFEPERCRQLVLEETYKAMARCLQRVKVERVAIQALIDKAERTDVIGKEDQYLSLEERVQLSKWREKEERVLGEIGRLDDLVGVLRDY